MKERDVLLGAVHEIELARMFYHYLAVGGGSAWESGTQKEAWELTFMIVVSFDT